MIKFFSLAIAIFVINIKPVMGAEVGMPQLDSEFWIAQIFWLIFTFSILYIVIWKLILPKIADGIENRKKHIVNDLDEAQILKKEAEKKLEEYKKIIEHSKNQAKKIIVENNKKLENEINQKRKKNENEIEDEIIDTERQIKKFQKDSIENTKKIAFDLSNEIIKKTLDFEINSSNLSAIVNEISKSQTKKYL